MQESSSSSCTNLFNTLALQKRELLSLGDFEGNVFGPVIGRMRQSTVRLWAFYK